MYYGVMIYPAGITSDLLLTASTASTASTVGNIGIFSFQ